MSAAVWVRDAATVRRIAALQWLCAAPALLWACYAIGRQSLRAMAASDVAPGDGWRQWLLRGLSHYDPAAPWDCWIFGAAYLLPLYAAIALTASAWEHLLAHWRRRPRHPEVHLLGLLLVLLCPAGLPLGWAVLAASLMLAARELCGGAGRYRVQPAALGFLLLAGALAARAPVGLLPVEGGAYATALQAAQADGFAALAQRFSWWDAWLGLLPARIGGAAALPLLIGGALLLGAGLRPWRVAAGVGVGLAATAAAIDAGAPWYWQLVLGNTVLGALLLAADPVCAPATRAGQWGVGLATGVAAALLRRFTPLAEEALLLALVAGNGLTVVVERAGWRLAARLGAARARAPEGGPTKL